MTGTAEVEPVVLRAGRPARVRTSFGAMGHRWSLPVRMVGRIASLHLFADSPGGTMMELDANPSPLRDEVAGDVLHRVDGHLRVPWGPGRGFTSRSEAREGYRVPAGGSA